MKHLSRWYIPAVALVLAASSSLAYAQVNARVRGTVTDPTGAAIANVPVTATNLETGVRYPTMSQANGSYQFQQLPIGTYSISAAAPGFKGFSTSGITLTIDQEFVEPIKLDLGNASETVAVQADAAQVDTTNMQLSNIVTANQMQELPLIGRDFTQLELILPGVQAGSDRFRGYAGFSVNGSQTQQQSFLINGADSNDLPLNTVSFTPNLDALQEFNLVTGPLNAEYDRNSGAVVSTVVKQGTNQFHGNAFEFYRDTFLNTKNFFQQTAPQYHQNIFGGTIGGPVLKDKLFIFGAYQGQKARQPGTSTVNQVFSAAQRAGDYSSTTFSSNVIPASITIPGCASGTQTFASCFGPSGLNGQLPTAAINPISAKLISTYVPLPNSGTSGYVFNAVNTVDQKQILGRIDYTFRTTNQFTFVGIYQTNPATEGLPFTGATLPGFAETDLSHNQQYTFDYIRQLSSSAVNDFALHYTRFNYGAVYPLTPVAPSSLGFAINPQNTSGESLPAIAVNGAFTLGFSTNGPQPRLDSTYQVDDSFSKAFGHHNVKLGYDGRRFNVSNPFSSRNNGAYTFTAAAGANNIATSGNALLDFALGMPAQYAQGTGANIIAKAFLNYVYAQDTWKVTSNLTLSYGMGYQVDTPLHNLQFNDQGVTCFIPGQQSTVFTTAYSGLNYPGDPGCNDASGAVTKYTDFGPRFGFAYAPHVGFLSGGSSSKLSIRGGFGIYYNRTEEEASLQNLAAPPYGFSSAGAIDYGAKNPQFANPFLNLAVAGPQPNNVNPFPAAIAKPGQAVNFASLPSPYLSESSPKFRSPYAENFQLTIEREFPSQIVARLTYVGALGRHNQITVEGDPITSAGHAACLADTGCQADSNYQNRDYPTHTQFGYARPSGSFVGQNYFRTVGLISTEGSSNYNSLQASLNKGLTHGLYIQASYTLSHALDDSSNFENSGFGESGTRGYNQYQPSLNYGDAAFDARHRLVIAPIYNVPFRSSGKALSFYNLAATGWQITGISTFATGFPFDISYGGFGTSNSLWCSAYTSYYACPDVPVQTAPLVRTNPKVFQPNGNTSYFNGQSSANGGSFAQEPIGSFGNVRRNPYHGPGIFNSNVVVGKNLAFSSDGRRYIQLRLESDNVFNHTQFNAPDGNFSNLGSTFGQISSAADGRQTQLGAKIYF